MKRIGSHFSFDKHQRNGILFLCILLTSWQVMLWVIDQKFPSEKVIQDDTALSRLQKRRDSLKKVLLQTTIEQSRQINPNYLNEFSAYQLGMNLKEFRRLQDFRKEGKKIHSAEHFRQVTRIEDSLFSLLSPILVFPGNHGSNQKLKRTQPAIQLKSRGTGDLNKVSIKDLQSIRGIGEKLSRRITAYREYLGGYSKNDQLYEVYHLPEEVARRVLTRYQVKSKPSIEKTNVNSASFKQLLKLPYIDYQLTQKIVRFRDEKGGIKKLEELMKIDSFPLDKFDRIALYLLAE